MILSEIRVKSFRETTAQYQKISWPCQNFHDCYYKFDLLYYKLFFQHLSVPLPVANLIEASSNSTSIHLNWTMPDQDTLFRQFVVYMTSQYGVMSYELGSSERDMMLTGLVAGSMYNVSIRTSTGFEVSPAVEGVFYTCKILCHILSQYGLSVLLYP